MPRSRRPEDGRPAFLRDRQTIYARVDGRMKAALERIRRTQYPEASLAAVVRGALQEFITRRRGR